MKKKQNLKLETEFKNWEYENTLQTDVCQYLTNTHELENAHGKQIVMPMMRHFGGNN